MKAGKARYWLSLSAVLWLLAGLIPLFGQTDRAERRKRPFPSIRLAGQVRNEAAIRALGDKLPAVAEWYGKTPREMTRLIRRDRNLWVSPSGRLMYACELEVPLEAGPEAESAVDRDHIASYPLDQTFNLHSLPGSNTVLYLDFNGATVSGTAWNAGYNGGADIVAAPFDLDANPATFNTTELQRIQNIWKRVAEDYSPFDIDVTTEEPAPEALNRSSSTDTTYGNRVIITPTNFYPNAGGVSYVGTFNDIGDYYKISWAFSNMLANGEKYIAEACSHENGHAVGLHHQGVTGGTAYYQGQGDWAPIMGNSYYKNVTQWAKGEYAEANNTEDQLEVMRNYGLEYYPDDHGNIPGTATTLTGSTTLSGSGFIERNTDVDIFKFITGAGSISLGVNPSPIGPNLKILAELHDSGGNLIASSSLTDMGASISSTVPAGTYYLSISGVGSGDPVSTGYSDYCSLGQYIVTGAIVNPGSSMPPTAVISAAPTSGDAPLAVAFSGSASTDDGTIASYVWNFGDGSDVSSDPNPSHVFTAAGAYYVTLTVTDNEGLTGSSSITITVRRDVYVYSIVLSSSSSTTAVSASAVVTIKDKAGNAVSGASVTGSWSGIVQGTAPGATNASGVVSFSSPQSSVSGTFTFTVTGVSALGYTYDPQLNNQTSASVAVNLLQEPTDSTPPTINIAYPVAGSTVLGNISIRVNVWDDVSVTRVELYVDGLLKAVSTSAPFTTKWNTVRAAAGEHTLRAKAYDAAGNTSVSAGVTVIVPESVKRKTTDRILRVR